MALQGRLLLSKQTRNRKGCAGFMLNGRIIEFGGYAWRVLDVQNDRVLIVTEDIIQISKYHEESDATWRDCSLRKHLNSDLYNSFGEDDRARIIKAVNKNANNPWFFVNGGGDTEDRIFLLSLEDVCRYFGDSSIKLQNKGDQDMIDDSNNSNRIAQYNSEPCWWWLRSVGHGTDDAARVARSGRIDVRGDYINDGIGGGVRPALWLSVNENASMGGTA